MSERSAAPGGPVVIVAHDIEQIGGMERQLRELIGGLLAAGDRVTVVARNCTLAPHPNLRLIRIRGPRRPFALAYPWFLVWASLRLWLRRPPGVMQMTGAIALNRTDAIAVHLLHLEVAASTDYVRVSSDTRVHRLNARVADVMNRWSERALFRPGRTRALIAVSSGLGREIAQQLPIAEPIIEVIPNGVDAQAFRPDPERRAAARAELGLADDALVALFVGGEWRRKGVDVAIDAVGARPAWRLLVVGAGDAAEQEAAVQAAGAGGRVQFLGPRPDVERLFAAADAFLLPTSYETFSLVTYEAAASGLPLLVTRVSGVEDVLEDGVNGWFIERDAAQVAGRLAALEDPDARAAMGAAARTAAERHDWAAHVAAHRALYARLRQSR